MGNEVLAEGIDPNSVTKIYTELAPCTGPVNCSAYIQANFPRAQVYYSFTWDAAGKAERAAIFAEY